MEHTNGDYLRELGERLGAADHGERGRLIDGACKFLGVSRQTLYRRLQHAGWSSGRGPRADAGETTISYAELQSISNLMVESRRANGKRLMSCEDAIDILAGNGQLSVRPHASTVLRLLTRHRLHPDQLAQPTPHQELRSLHPNHVWQLDASVCVLFYMHGSGLNVMDKKKFYKNKPENVASVARNLCLRWVVTDHYTGSIFVRYYVGSGETQEMLFDVLMHAMARKDGHPVHGVPFILVSDKGAANRAHMILRLLERMQVQVIAHAAGNSRAKGQVEKAQDLVERSFESRLYLMHIRDVDHLNESADVWMRHYNARQVHGRHGSTRWGLWSSIRPHQLRMAPARAVCEELLSTKPQERRVKGNLVVEYQVKGYERMTYDVAHVPGVCVGDKVRLAVNPYRAPHIDVLITDDDGKERAVECQPLERDAAGFFLRAAVIGEETKRPADTEADAARKTMLKQAYDADTLAEADKKRERREPAFGGQIDPITYLGERAQPTFIDRPGTELPMESPREVVFMPVPVPAACKRLKTDHGVDLPGLYDLVKQRYPGGVPEDQLPVLAAELLGTTMTAAPKLALVK